jgi:hypothetical protein
MLYYTNTFRDYTTVILEIEDNIHANDIPQVREQLLGLGQIVDERSLHIINKRDEDIHTGWKFVVVTTQTASCIQSVIDDILEILIG